MEIRSDSLKFTVVDVRIAVGIIVYMLVLAIFPLGLSEPDFRWTFSEVGPFERLAIAAWMFTGLLVIFRIRPLGKKAWALALLCMVFAGREADLHKAFTAGSLLKINYYKHTVAPIAEKILAGAVAIAAIGLVVYVGLVIARFLFRQGGWRSRSGIWLILATTLVVLGKALDRAPAVLFEEYGITLSPIIDLYAAAFEEGMEMIHPLILAWSVWISQTERRYLSDAEPQTEFIKRYMNERQETASNSSLPRPLPLAGIMNKERDMAEIDNRHSRKTDKEAA